VKWNSPFYGAQGSGWFVSVHCFDKFVRLTFFDGTSLDPMPPGTSKTAGTRYLDIYEHDDVVTEQLASWIRQAAALPGWTQ
jgi:hypothetical protein